METRSCQIVYRYGEDDFSVWEVNVDEKDYFHTLKDAGITLGDMERLLKTLPIDDALHFHLKKSNGDSWILTSYNGEKFINKYSHQGCSVRGTLEDIIEELEK